MVPDSSLAYDTSVYMENAVFSQYEEERTKLLLSQYGSVSAMIYMDSSGRYYNPDTAASCYPSSGSVNHAVPLSDGMIIIQRKISPPLPVSRIMVPGSSKTATILTGEIMDISIFPMRISP